MSISQRWFTTKVLHLFTLNKTEWQHSWYKSWWTNKRKWSTTTSAECSLWDCQSCCRTMYCPSRCDHSSLDWLMLWSTVWCQWLRKSRGKLKEKQKLKCNRTTSLKMREMTLILTLKMILLTMRTYRMILATIATTVITPKESSQTTNSASFKEKREKKTIPTQMKMSMAAKQTRILW